MPLFTEAELFKFLENVQMMRMIEDIIPIRQKKSTIITSGTLPGYSTPTTAAGTTTLSSSSVSSLQNVDKKVLIDGREASIRLMSSKEAKDLQQEIYHIELIIDSASKPTESKHTFAAATTTNPDPTKTLEADPTKTLEADPTKTLDAIKNPDADTIPTVPTFRPPSVSPPVGLMKLYSRGVMSNEYKLQKNKIKDIVLKYAQKIREALDNKTLKSIKDKLIRDKEYNFALGLYEVRDDRKGSENRYRKSIFYIAAQQIIDQHNEENDTFKNFIQNIFNKQRFFDTKANKRKKKKKSKGDSKKEEKYNNEKSKILDIIEDPKLKQEISIFIQSQSNKIKQEEFDKFIELSLKDKDNYSKTSNIPDFCFRMLDIFGKLHSDDNAKALQNIITLIKNGELNMKDPIDNYFSKIYPIRDELQTIIHLRSLRENMINFTRNYKVLHDTLKTISDKKNFFIQLFLYTSLFINIHLHIPSNV